MAAHRVWRAAVVGSMVLTAAGCGLTRQLGFGHVTQELPVTARLTAFSSCDEMLSQLRAEALAKVGPDGLPDAVTPVHAAAGLGFTAPLAAGRVASGEGATGTTGAGSAETPATGGLTFSSTNDQEQGVDEPDLAKTDDKLLVALRRQDNDLEIADVSSSPRMRGSIALSQGLSPSGLFLVGANAVVLATSWASSPSTTVEVVSLADPGHPTLARSFTIAGTELDARLIGGRIEVVVQSSPRLPFVAPSDQSAAASAKALEANRVAILQSTPADWLPTVTSEPSGTTTTGPCTSAMQPNSPDGLDTVSVVPIDPGTDQYGSALTIVGDGDTVYASTTTLFVASPLWPASQGSPTPRGAPARVSSSVGSSAAIAEPAQPTEPQSTAIYGFDLSDPAAPRYLGSGSVPGALIGQYAMSEYQGYLRVATTVGGATPPPNEGVVPTVESDNRVTVLKANGGSFVTVASVGGLGGGEKIYAVRFLGPLGYIVTFRQTDPLYVLDLSDPLRPQLRGQLVLDGYSSFLEPLQGNLLLGVGESVDGNLRVQGLQVSLFDASDPANPRLVGKEVLEGGNSLAETDPHALLYWAPKNLVVLPVQQYGTGEGDQGSPFDGAIAFDVSGGALREAGRVTQPEPPTSAAPQVAPGCPDCAESMPSTLGGTGIERSLVAGSMLYTVSEAGITVNDLSSLKPQAWSAYP
jgi:Beta propeller domain